MNDGLSGEPNTISNAGQNRRGRPKSKRNIEWIEIPVGVMNLAHRRTKPLLDHYGRNITSMQILTLASSCYLQGIEDAMSYVDGVKSNQNHNG